ncbi:hypothetical protein YC2023_106539 [Brassica napus]
MTCSRPTPTCAYFGAESIDVEEIVMEHYHSTCTHQPSSYPKGFRYILKASATSCSNCSHGVKLGLCLQASSHVEQMKDALLAAKN